MKTSYGSFFKSIHSSFSDDHVEPKIITIYDKYGSEGTYEPSLERETSSSGSLDSLLSNVGGRTSRVEVPIPLLPYRMRRHG